MNEKEQLNQRYKGTFAIKWVYNVSLAILVFIFYFFSNIKHNNFVSIIIVFISLIAIVGSFLNSFYLQKYYLKYNKKKIKNVYGIFLIMSFILLFILFYLNDALFFIDLRKISYFLLLLSLLSFSLSELYEIIKTLPKI